MTRVNIFLQTDPIDSPERASDGLWAMGYGLWAMGYGLWAMGYGLWAMGYGLWAMATIEQISGTYKTIISSG
ncbi:MAG: hypothetical protein HY879_24220 [Deltaproteobacteria bacterium]|nr:hypothetical protein [Deltaproteobacteria bacterium]